MIIHILHRAFFNRIEMKLITLRRITTDASSYISMQCNAMQRNAKILNEK